MIAIRVHYNGAELCTAGIGDDGMIGTSLHWVRRTGDRVDPDCTTGEEIEMGFHIGGIHSPTDTHHNWQSPELEVGDTIQITIVETETINPPDEITPVRRSSASESIESEKTRVRKKAAEWGWVIDERIGDQAATGKP